MGAMVLNEAFRGMEPTMSSAQRPRGAIPYIKMDRIIYLAAACSIRDFNDTAGQYLMQNTNTRCYNLCLNPAREVKEEFPTYATPIVLSGSLLMWIDEFFERPRDFQDRTLGSFENCIVAYRHMPNTSRFNLKAFKDDSPLVGRSKSGPQKHGEFASYPFWDEHFLSPCDPNEDRKYDPIY